ncbi:FAD-dependent monooxygenase [Actinosynnema pretiosum]|uniref:2,4-dichlorophenol 6-monooxygenase n=2 Tax=Actinosynnema TaxID=40566 RepID=A0A290Z6D7_9PSEU|nr:FAD-dependent monooxygenase [Actinosynnema pretiosum]ATE54597.1 2,4-dichlorophenol 6-monooxygenase [Actinosynnema pretiosum]
MHDHLDTDVLVAGGGSVGLLTALFLARRGVRVVVAERAAAPQRHPRAMGIGPRTVEVLREAGLHEAVDALCVDMRGSGLGMFSARTLAEADLPALAAAAPPRAAEFDAVSPGALRGTCPQNRLDEVLLAEVRRLGAQVRFGAELTSLDQDDRSVTAEVGGARVRARYLVGADGVRGAVRPAVGIGVSGPGPIGLPLVSALFRADLLDLTGGRQFIVCDVTTPEAPGGLLPVDGRHEWIYHTRFDPSAGQRVEDFTPSRCRALVRAAVGDPDREVEVVSVLPWQARGVLADDFRAGRVFLVGDAAHVIPPVGAFGLNTGVADAHNLAWKLAAVLRGEAGGELLGTYGAERRPVAAEALRQSVLRLGDPSLHWARGPEGAAKRAAAGAVNAPLVHLGYRYRSSAVLGGGAEPPSTEDVALALNGDPGSRVPHAWVDGPEGRVSTVDLVAGGFAVLAGPEGAAWVEAAALASGALGVPVRARVLGGGSGLVPEARWPGVAGIGADGALLVRPDGFVAWRAERAGADPAGGLLRAMTAVLAR